jgi:hypothetical protein
VRIKEMEEMIATEKKGLMEGIKALELTKQMYSERKLDNYENSEVIFSLLQEEIVFYKKLDLLQKLNEKRIEGVCNRIEKHISAYLTAIGSDLRADDLILRYRQLSYEIDTIRDMIEIKKYS